MSGPAAPADVWERYAEPARWSSWSPQIRSVVLEGGATRIAAGVRGTVRTFAPVGVPFTVLEVNETERTWRWRVGPGITMSHGVEPDGGGTTTWLRIEGPALLLPVLTAYVPVARLALRRLVR